ncbi:MAG TPA: hypothetical protein VJW17_08710 [Pyrinomonadaceae bacterium]|nr:hypothetical protein [Pyrinomonadaceae bacterium]
MAKRTTKGKKASAGSSSTPASRKKKIAAAATLLPLAISMIPGALSLRQPTAKQAAEEVQVTAKAPQVTPKEFTIPISDLQKWASSVLVTLNDIKIEGNSAVHKEEADCEIHFGAHSPSFKGDPSGLVLEPMNACSLPFPGQPEQSNADYLNFAKRLKDTSVKVTGVPRIWPEHLEGGGASNPDHAVELHPLTDVVESDGRETNFTANLSAGEFRGGVSSPTAQSIVKQTRVTVTRNGNDAQIDFFGGRIGNFTVLEVNVEPKSIAADGAGSFRMNGQVVLDDGENVPVSMVTVSASPFNDTIARLQSGGRKNIVNLGEVLVLFSLSPQFLLEAANKSNGQAVAIERPIQLILYGPPD